MTEQRQKVLFVSDHNSSRSQMAETILNHLGKNRFTAMSAGLEPGGLHPYAIRVMLEIGLDISHNETKSILSLYQKGELFSYVITVCDEASAERCPTYPGITKRVHWNVEDPANVQGDDEEKLQAFRKVRDQILKQTSEWLESV